MSDNKIKLPADPAAAYKQGISERAARMREERRQGRAPLPNLSEADAAFDPRKSPPATLGNLGAAQKHLGEKREEQQTPGLSADTIAGLAAMKDAMDKKRADIMSQPAAQTAPTEAPEAPDGPADPESKADLAGDIAAGEEKKGLIEAVRNLDEYEYERIQSAIQKDVINNVKERKAVEDRLEKLGNEISLSDGLSDGVFRQIVPVTDSLNVHYRSVSPMENRAIRLLLWNWVDKDPRLENLAADYYGMMLIVAAVEQIGTNKLPEHMVGANFYTSVFTDEAFEQKFQLLSRYPGPLIHAIGVHANWFDERVRKLFVTGELDTLKNG